MADAPDRPDFGDAVFSLEKLTHYALDSSNQTGQHKARMFRSIFDFGPEDAEVIREQILDNVADGDLAGTKDTPHGMRYEIDVSVCGNNDRTAPVKTVWQVDREGGPPRLITLRPLKD